MAHDEKPFDPALDMETRRRLFNELDYNNMNGTRATVTFPGDGKEVPVPHGFAFTPLWESLTLRPHNANADIGTIYMTRDPDESYVYLATPRAGRAVVEITHPPRSG